jgi:class 3 adenylate cyclase
MDGGERAEDVPGAAASVRSEGRPAPAASSPPDDAPTGVASAPSEGRARILRRREAGPRRVLVAVLFTDIVGSTELAARLGDRAWRDLLARHHALVRRELRRCHGREIDTAGDGFFATFEQPMEAIACAAWARDALADLSLAIRAGIHVGEAEVMGDKVGGMTVHVASRVREAAGPGEILVTGTVRDITLGGDVTFTERGSHALKGVPGEWPLYAAEWVPPPAVPSAKTGDGGRDAPAMPRAWRRWAALAIGAALLTCIGIVVAIAALGPGGGPAPTAAAQSVVEVDASSGRLLSSLPIARPAGIAAAGDFVWALAQEGLVDAIPVAGGAASPVRLPGTPTGIAADADAAWITFGHGVPGESQGIVVRVASGSFDEQPIPLGPGSGATGIAVGEGGVWVVNEIANTLTRLDPATRAVVGSAEVGEQPVAVAVGEGSVWVAHAVDRSVWRLDPRTMARTASVSLSDVPTAIVVAFGRAWVSSTAGNSVAVIDATTAALLSTIEVDQRPRGITAGDGDIWVAGGRGSIVRIDPAADPLVADIHVNLPGPVEGVATAGDSVWGTVQ